MNKNIHDYCNRFMGVDIQYRRFGCDWEKPWRLKQVHSSKNRKGSVDLKYFHTLEEVLAYMEGTKPMMIHKEAIEGYDYEVRISADELEKWKKQLAGVSQNTPYPIEHLTKEEAEKRWES